MRLKIKPCFECKARLSFFSHILFQLKLFNLRYLYVSRKYLTFAIAFAELAQLVEHWLPKPRVAGSSPVFRSISPTPFLLSLNFWSESTKLPWVLLRSAPGYAQVALSSRFYIYSVIWICISIHPTTVKNHLHFRTFLPKSLHNPNKCLTFAPQDPAKPLYDA